MEFTINESFSADLKYAKAAKSWQALLTALSNFHLSSASEENRQNWNEQHNKAKDAQAALKILNKAQVSLQQSLVKHDKIYRKNYHRDTWLALGVGGIGIGLGAALGSALGSMAYIGLGMPIGMLIGILIGRNMDQKAEQEGKVYYINS